MSSALDGGEMDREEIERHLKEARGREAQAARCVQRQEALLARSEAEGLDLPTARQFLAILMEAQRLTADDREWLERKLAGMPDRRSEPFFRALLRRSS